MAYFNDFSKLLQHFHFEKSLKYDKKNGKQRTTDLFKFNLPKKPFLQSSIPPKCQKRNHNLIANNWVSILFSIPTLICRASLSHQHSLRIFCVRCLVLCHHTLIMRVISWSFWGKLMIIMVHLNKKVKLFWLEKTMDSMRRGHVNFSTRDHP